MSQLFLCSEETFYEIVNRTSDGKEEIKDEVSEENKEEKRFTWRKEGTENVREAWKRVSERGGGGRGKKRWNGSLCDREREGERARGRNRERNCKKKASNGRK